MNWSDYMNRLFVGMRGFCEWERGYVDKAMFEEVS